MPDSWSAWLKKPRLFGGGGVLFPSCSREIQLTARTVQLYTDMIIIIVICA